MDPTSNLVLKQQLEIQLTINTQTVKMPELVEVDQFARLIQPLVSKNSPITIEFTSQSPPKNFLSGKDFEYIQKCYVYEVERKGKLIRIHLQKINQESNEVVGLLYFHMGMTGRISTPDNIAKLESLSADDEYPPPHTHLILKSNDHEISFSDPRKFGAVCLNNNGPLQDQWDSFAPDALDEDVSLNGFVGQKKGVKALLLDQRAVISGVGNWIADEVLYQSKIHPDQNYLTQNEVDELKSKLRDVLKVGIQCSKDGTEYPQEWIFHSRWKKRSKEVLKDKDGHIIEFVQSGGRTSAFVPNIQKKKSRKSGQKKKTKTKKRETMRKIEDDGKEEKGAMKEVKEEETLTNDKPPSTENNSIKKRRSSRIAKKVKLEN